MSKANFSGWNGMKKLSAVILGIIILGLLLITFGNSQTTPLDEKGSITFKDEPSNSFGDPPDNLNWSPDLSNVDPSNLPPINPGNIPGGGLPPPSGNPPDIDPPQVDPPSNLPDIPKNPDIQPPDVNPPDINPPDFSGSPDNPGGFGSGDFGIDPPQNIEQNPSKYKVFPVVNLSKLTNFSFSFAGINFKISIQWQTLLVLLIIALPLLILLSIPKIISLKREEETPVSEIKDIKEQKRRIAEERKRRERRRKLNTFKDFVNEILENIDAWASYLDPTDLVITVYHELDHAFGKFSNLKRGVGVTPLEHSRSVFTDEEINTSSLEKIVNLFYQTRFGHKSIVENDISSLKDMLSSLVRRDALND